MLDVVQWLVSIDQSLFIFINQTLANPVTDFFMPLVTADSHLRVFYALCMMVILWKGDRRLRYALIFSLITLVITDQLSSSIFKPLLARPRPCQSLNIHLLVSCGAGFSLPSSHAANLFGQAFLFRAIIPRTAKFLIPLAIVVALSRIFVGVHYPFDILVGSVIGLLAGTAVAGTFMKMFPEKAK
ncbi:MAG: phosphatase PAP2 family protein [candidate division Zixibacteria bacterium]|nr:phosphatase PAP2 family protein [candidate division Zixibacteria bacterium]